MPPPPVHRPLTRRLGPRQGQRLASRGRAAGLSPPAPPCTPAPSPRAPRLDPGRHLRDGGGPELRPGGLRRGVGALQPGAPRPSWEPPAAALSRGRSGHGAGSSAPRGAVTGSRARGERSGRKGREGKDAAALKVCSPGARRSGCCFIYLSNYVISERAAPRRGCERSGAGRSARSPRRARPSSRRGRGAGKVCEGLRGAGACPARVRGRDEPGRCGGGAERCLAPLPPRPPRLSLLPPTPLPLPRPPPPGLATSAAAAAAGVALPAAGGRRIAFPGRLQARRGVPGAGGRLGDAAARLAGCGIGGCRSGLHVFPTVDRLEMASSSTPSIFCFQRDSMVGKQKGETRACSRWDVSVPGCDHKQR